MIQDRADGATNIHIITKFSRKNSRNFRIGQYRPAMQNNSDGQKASRSCFLGAGNKIIQICVGLGHSKDALATTAMKETIAPLLAIHGPIFCVSELRKAERH